MTSNTYQRQPWIETQISRRLKSVAALKELKKNTVYSHHSEIENKFGTENHPEPKIMALFLARDPTKSTMISVVELQRACV